MDNFGFEKITFSIVNAEQVHLLEHKIMYLDNWSTRMRQKPAMASHLTKMATFSNLSKLNPPVTGGYLNKERHPPSPTSSSTYLNEKSINLANNNKHL